MDHFGENPFLRDHDRRRSRRRAAHTRAWADPGGIAPVVDCLIVDVSEEGAGVAALNGAELPDAFQLEVDVANAVGEAQVAWRTGRAVGVKLARPK